MASAVRNIHINLSTSIAAAAKQSYFQRTMAIIWTADDTFKALGLLIFVSFFVFALRALLTAEAKLNAKEAKAKSS